MRHAIRPVFAKFFADRGTHLAAMIAYFALLSFFPLVFLALAFLGLAHRADESSYFVDFLENAFPETSIKSIVSAVRAIQDNAATLGIVGGVTLLWTSLSLFSVLESAFNVVYGRPNRSFLRGKGLALLFMTGSLVVLFVALLVGSLGFDVLRRYAPGFIGNDVVAGTVSVLVSTAGVFIFVVFAYERLTNLELTFREVLPGAIVATVSLEASFQLLPLYLRLSNNLPALQAFGGPVLLLVWLYVMSNVIVFGAELNWWLEHRRESATALEGAAGLA